MALVDHDPLGPPQKLTATPIKRRVQTLKRREDDRVGRAHVVDPVAVAARVYLIDQLVKLNALVVEVVGIDLAILRELVERGEFFFEALALALFPTLGAVVH